MGKDPSRNVIEDARLKYMNSCEQQWNILTSLIGVVIGRLRRHASKASHQTVACFDYAEALILDVRIKNQRGERFRPAMCMECLSEINVCNDLAVDDEKGLTFEMVSGII